MADTRETVFRFRQFSIKNAASAMKVCTDSVVLGAWVDTEGVYNILDIGCGTGILSLMAAQRAPMADIIGIEIDHAAAKEALANVEASPWSHRIKIVENDVTSYDFGDELFDLIICNPPYFKDSLKPEDVARFNARHEEGSLTIDNLMKLGEKLLKQNGRLALILPYDREKDIEFSAAMAHLVPERRLDIKTAPGKTPKRTLWQFARCPVSFIRGEMTLQNSDGTRSEALKSLTSEFYL